MNIVRHFAINLIRVASEKKSIKLRQKVAGWDPNCLAQFLGALTGQPGFVALPR
jgi:hypothetical protein